MEKEFKDDRGSSFFFGLRWAERHVALQTLYSFLKPFAFARATLNTVFKNPHPRADLPECLKARWSWRMARQKRMSGYLNYYLEYFPDRLADAKWKDCCRIVGGDQLLKAWQSGRPVV